MCKKLIYQLFVILLGANLLIACAPVAPLGDGVIDALQEGTTIWTIDGALKQLPGTLRMYKPGSSYWLFARFNDSGKLWSYIFSDVSRDSVVIEQQIALGGNCANCNTFHKLVNSMVEQGWRFTQNPALPESFWTGLVNAMTARASWISVIATTLPGSFDIPWTILPTPDIE
jgi:hypothetical protein